jgi:hypothetical protein
MPTNQPPIIGIYAHPYNYAALPISNKGQPVEHGWNSSRSLSFLPPLLFFCFYLFIFLDSFSFSSFIHLSYFIIYLYTIIIHSFCFFSLHYTHTYTHIYILYEREWRGPSCAIYKWCAILKLSLFSPSQSPPPPALALSLLLVGYVRPGCGPSNDIHSTHSTLIT